MKIIAYYTDSHELLFNNYFIKSLNLVGFDMNNVYAKRGTQYSLKGSYLEKEGFNKSTADKLSHLLDVMNSLQDEYVCFSDVDVFFYQNINNDFYENYHVYKDYHIIAQNDLPNIGDCICTGFMYLKNCTLVKNFIQKIIDNTKFFEHDQYCLNAYKKDIKYLFLDINKYFTIASVNNCNVWHENQNHKPINKKDMIVHHANWVVGVDNKIKLIEYVKNL